MIADGFLTRSGVFSYRDANGKERLEYRPPAEVFAADSLESFAMVPVTDGHPNAPLTSANMKQFAVGSTGETIKQDGDHVSATIVIFDAATIAKVDAGKSELSCGYFADIDPTPGVSPEGERYDMIQRNPRGNHVAIVDRGRAGPTVRIRTDAAIMITADDRKEHTMDPELTKALTDALRQTNRADAAEVATTTEKARADAAEVATAAEKTRADKAEAERDAAVTERDTLRTDAETIKTEALAGSVADILVTDGKPDDLAGQTRRQIKVATIKRLANVEVSDDKSDDYVSARFDAAIDARKAGANALAGTKTAVGNPSAGNLSGAARARADMIAHQDNLANATE